MRWLSQTNLLKKFHRRSQETAGMWTSFIHTPGEEKGGSTNPSPNPKDSLFFLPKEPLPAVLIALFKGRPVGQRDASHLHLFAPGRIKRKKIKRSFMKTLKTQKAYDNTHDNEWVVFLNGKVFYLDQTKSLRDEEAGKAFFDSIMPILPSAAVPMKTPVDIFPLEESQIH